MGNCYITIYTCLYLVGTSYITLSNYNGRPYWGKIHQGIFLPPKPICDFSHDEKNQ